MFALAGRSLILGEDLFQGLLPSPVGGEREASEERGENVLDLGDHER